ncbi:MAG: CPBP family intramembrane metalloprotease [Firmicutes bacterium]|nr:CPBP family intramembrane metalloprotease [Bacillota bacterium]
MRLFDLTRKDVNGLDPRALWIIGVLGALVFMSLGAHLLPATQEVRLGLLVLQQTLFVLAGIMGFSQKKVKQPLGHMFAQGLLAGLGIHVANRLSGVLSQRIAIELVGHEVVQRQILREIGSAGALLNSKEPLILLGIVLLLVVGAPLGEELFFRGLLLNLWRERYGGKKAVIFSALTFALLHFYLLQFVPVLIAGVLLGILFVRTENIVIPIIAHATANSLVLLAWLFSL